MGNNSFLDIRRHIEGIILKTDRPEQAQDIHDLVHAIEVLMQIEHMNIAMFGVKRKDNDDFPLDIDFE